MVKQKLFFVLFMGLCFVCAEAKAQMPVQAVEGVVAQKGTITKSIQLISLIKANKEAHVISSISGVVRVLAVKEGAQVKAGTLLAALDKPEYARGAKAAASNTKAAKRQYERSEKLYAAQVISKEALEASKAAWSNAQIAEANAKTLLDQSEFRAPFDGVCGVFRVTQGAYVNPGDEIVAFYDPQGRMLEFAVPEAVVTKINVGDSATVFDQKGTIVSVQRAMDPVTNMGLARATLPPCDKCVVGAYVDVGLVVEKKENVLGVPQDALFLKEGLQQVYIVQKDKAVLTPVTVGLRGDDKVEILKGVNAGDVVVTRGQNKLNDGAPVKVSL